RDWPSPTRPAWAPSRSCNGQCRGRLPPLAREGGRAVPEATIEAYYLEDRTFPPPEEFCRNALVSDTKLYEEAETDWEGFWARQARELVSWFDDFDTVLEWDLPFAKWFQGGTLNVSYNCLDRHVEAGRGDTVADHGPAEPG